MGKQVADGNSGDSSGVDFKKFALTKRRKLHKVSDRHYWKLCPGCGEWFEVKLITRKTIPSHCPKCNRANVMAAYYRDRATDKEYAGILKVFAGETIIQEEE